MRSPLKTRIPLFAFTFCALILTQTSFGQKDVPVPPIDTYIHHAWDTLSRSMNDCSSVVDPKLNSISVLYLPADFPEPVEVKSLQSSCRIQVERLPRRIEHLGDVMPRELKQAGLLYLPNKYVVPGGRFNEMYGWDSYFILLGLLQDGRTALAKGMVENFFFEIEHYGGILNANRTYYFTRSQPPFLSSMIRAVYDAEIADGHTADAKTWLARSYAYAQRDHALWMTDIHRAGDTGLARYYDLGDGPVPEMADDSSYYADVIRWLLAHPRVHTDYLVHAPEQSQLTAISCDPGISSVCAHAHVGEYWLSRDFYKGDRAMRESGFDPSFRYGPFSGWTHHNADAGLNALLYKYERDLQWMAGQLNRPAGAAHWSQIAGERRTAVNKYLWNAQKGMYFDYDFVARKQSTYNYITTFYPLWAGLANAQQIKSVEANLRLFEKPGGLAMSSFDSGVQWDLPYGWAPTTWIAVDGLAKSSDIRDAVRVAREFMTTIRQNYLCDQTIHEKYDVITASSQVNVARGYKTNVVGFGWTNAAYIKMQDLVNHSGIPLTPINVPRQECSAQTMSH
ncbi:trehalase family glycosidase [Paracidobacterium acidisoli]|uniref:Trehalase n=1 Tax=Paracidobacterium acidisoli TaxID=2303751 RepID=A0A372INH0_9BACT|nr:trehalase family glycosidase [Paracidobacterium acidisoli]MBT9331959.1 trehalase [Paracidobacterium acidisoli]